MKVRIFFSEALIRRADFLPLPNVRLFVDRARTAFMHLRGHFNRCKKERNRYPDNPFTLHA